MAWIWLSLPFMNPKMAFADISLPYRVSLNFDDVDFFVFLISLQPWKFSFVNRISSGQTRSSSTRNRFAKSVFSLTSTCAIRSSDVELKVSVKARSAKSKFYWWNEEINSNMSYDIFDNYIHHLHYLTKINLFCYLLFLLFCQLMQTLGKTWDSKRYKTISKCRYCFIECQRVQHNYALCCRGIFKALNKT